MVQRMLIDATHPEETRVVAVNGHRLEEFDYETTTKLQLKGNIYLAKVTRVEPSLQAAFVEYGGNRHGFLAFSEIHPDYYRIPVGDREEIEEEETPDEDETASENGGVEVMGGDEGSDEALEETKRARPRLKRQYKIQEVIKRRQVLLVQVLKEERGNKGAALTTYLSLAGRYCVLMPNTSRGGGVSRKIANPQDRKRLKSVLSELDVPEGMAVILRTAGQERSKAEIKRDFEYIMRMWDDVRGKTLDSAAPALIHEEANLIRRSIRDLYSKDFDEVLVSGDDGYRIAKDFMKAMIPSHAKKVKRYTDEQGVPMFQRYQVENQLNQIYDPVVQLRSGGSIVLHQTEALVAIDVNSGKATRERHIEETAIKTNLEAAEEIARQLRLRDLAGLVVIDFIDMEENRNDHAVERRLKEALRSDRARIQVGRVSPFGLLEMSRQRLRPSVLEAMTQPCLTCGGIGYIPSTESAALQVLRAIEEEGLRRRSSEITVEVPPTVALYLLNHKRATMAEIETGYEVSIVITTNDDFIPPKFILTRVAKDNVEGEVIVTHPDPVPSSDEGEESSRSSRRRRGRRKRRRSNEDGEGNDQSLNRNDQDNQTGDADSELDEDNSDRPVTARDGDGEGDGTRRRRKRGRRGGRRRRGRDGDEQQTNEVSSEQTGDAVAATDTESGDRDQNADQPDTVEAVAAEAASTAAVSEGVAEDAAGSEEEAPKPRRRSRTPRKSAAAAKSEPEATPAETSEGEPAVEAATEQPAGDASTDDREEAPAKPKRRTKAAARKTPASKKTTRKVASKTGSARKKKADAEAEVTSDVTAAPIASPVSEVAPVSEPSVTASAPEVQSAANNDSPPAAEPEKDKPKRKGWWNKMIGS